jgi:hypothetical protein
MKVINRSWKHPALGYVHLLNGYESYKEYRKTEGRRKITDEKDLMKIYRAIFREIQKQIVESPGGVFIRGVGYFFVWKIPRKLYFKHAFFDQKPWYGNAYSIRFIPVKRLRGWSFQRRFSQNLSGKVFKKLCKGFRYKVYLYSLRVLNLMK